MSVFCLFLLSNLHVKIDWFGQGKEILWAHLFTDTGKEDQQKIFSFRKPHPKDVKFQDIKINKESSKRQLRSEITIHVLSESRQKILKGHTEDYSVDNHLNIISVHTTSFIIPRDKDSTTHYCANNCTPSSHNCAYT
ncbi:hypothetical protein ROZALSC1DRAFT_23188 [Rozella allomycis CSF55]|uniref:Uncharacterized protein n=1 Tax=Rozella allomycis (strain CSF55) TaxID=988480 RepID=A0A4P9YJC3_ROZAC|nr:hypothetical protein ROZALSC1DRAFT_23188 [Rozella allomycis CSF55]